MKFPEKKFKDFVGCPWNEPLHNHHDGCPACCTKTEYQVDYQNALLEKSARWGFKQGVKQAQKQLRARCRELKVPEPSNMFQKGVNTVLRKLEGELK